MLPPVIVTGVDIAGAYVVGAALVCIGLICLVGTIPPLGSTCD